MKLQKVAVEYARLSLRALSGLWEGSDKHVGEQGRSQGKVGQNTRGVRQGQNNIFLGEHLGHASVQRSQTPVTLPHVRALGALVQGPDRLHHVL